MRLGIEKRNRLVMLYIKHGLSRMRGKYNILSELAASEDISIRPLGARYLIEKYQETGSIVDRRPNRYYLKNACPLTQY